MGHAAFARALNTLQVTPHPPGVTELYFTNYHRPPASLKPGATQRLAFTVHSLEHSTTTYHYRIVAKPTEGTERPLNEGTFTLAAGHSQTTRQTITIPPTAGRMAVEVDLDYAATTFGSSAPSTQKQSIRYWVDVVDSRAHL